MKQTITFLALVFSFYTFAQKREYYSYYGDKTEKKYADLYRTVTEMTNVAGETRYFVEDRYMSDTLRAREYYKDKKLTIKDGAATTYFENGRKKLEAFYVDGKLHGKHVQYDYTGTISEEKFYDHGALEGKYSSYYKNGSLQSEYLYVNDKRHGESISYYENGAIETRQEYAAGKKHGEGLMYSENGTLLSKTTYSNGEKGGNAFDYYENGELEGEEHYLSGKLEGTSRWYYKNGQLSSIEQYTGNELKSFELFNEDGTPDTVTGGPGEGPQFPGGMSGMKRYLADNIRYPQNAMELGISGKVYLTFVIAIDGKVTNVVVKRGIIDCPECDAEARRVISQMPDWIPGKTHNRWMNVHYNLPIGFTLQ